jgi:hypothetical protein
MHVSLTPPLNHSCAPIHSSRYHPQVNCNNISSLVSSTSHVDFNLTDIVLSLIYKIYTSSRISSHGFVFQWTPHNNPWCESHQLSIVSNSSTGGIRGSGGLGVRGGISGAGGNAEGPQFNVSGARNWNVTVHGGRSFAICC